MKDPRGYRAALEDARAKGGLTAVLSLTGLHELYESESFRINEEARALYGRALRLNPPHVFTLAVKGHMVVYGMYETSVALVATDSDLHEFPSRKSAMTAIEAGRLYAGRLVISPAVRDALCVLRDELASLRACQQARVPMLAAAKLAASLRGTLWHRPVPGDKVLTVLESDDASVTYRCHDGDLVSAARDVHKYEPLSEEQAEKFGVMRAFRTSMLVYAGGAAAVVAAEAAVAAALAPRGSGDFGYRGFSAEEELARMLERCDEADVRCALSAFALDPDFVIRAATRSHASLPRLAAASEEFAAALGLDTRELTDCQHAI